MLVDGTGSPVDATLDVFPTRTDLLGIEGLRIANETAAAPAPAMNFRRLISGLGQLI